MEPILAVGVLSIATGVILGRTVRVMGLAVVCLLIAGATIGFAVFGHGHAVQDLGRGIAVIVLVQAAYVAGVIAVVRRPRAFERHHHLRPWHSLF